MTTRKKTAAPKAPASAPAASESPALDPPALDLAALDPLSPGACTAFNLRRASRAVSQYYDAALEPTGLRGTQYTVLSSTALAGPLAMRPLAERLGMDRTTLTRNLGPLEARGLLHVRPGADRRARLVELTPAGRKTLDRARPYWKQAQADLVARLGETQWRALVGNLAAVAAAVRA